MRNLSGHKKDVRSVAFAPDGRLVSGGSDKTVRVWNPATGECLVTIKTKTPIYAVAVSPDGSLLAYGGRYEPQAESNHVTLCDLTGKIVNRFELRFERNQLERVEGTFEFVTVSRPDPRSIWSLTFSSNGSHLAGCCRVLGGGNFPNGGGGKCWALPKGKPASGLASKAYSVAFSSSDQILAVTGENCVKFYPDPMAKDHLEYPTAAGWSAAVAFIPGRDLAVIASNSAIYFVNPRQKEKAKRVKTGLRNVTGLAASPDGKSVLAGGKPGSVEVYDVESRIKTCAFDFGIGGVHGVAFSPDGLTFAIAGDKGLILCDSPE